MQDGLRKFLIVAAVFCVLDALLQLLFFKSIDFCNLILATILYVLFSIITDIFINRC